jgi:hypothetical protein
MHRQQVHSCWGQGSGDKEGGRVEREGGREGGGSPGI